MFIVFKSGRANGGGSEEYKNFWTVLFTIQDERSRKIGISYCCEDIECQWSKVVKGLLHCLSQFCLNYLLVYFITKSKFFVRNENI